MSCKGKKINSRKLHGNISAVELIDNFFGSYNAGRVNEICNLLATKALDEDVYVGLALSGALTPAGLGAQVIVPMMEKGFIDYIISTGANLYHDVHFALNLPLYRSSPFLDDRELKEKKLVRIYDIIMDFDVLLKSDQYVERIIGQPEFQKRMGTAELHYLMGKYVDKTEQELGVPGASILAAAYRNAIPVYTPSPGDSTIGLCVAVKNMTGSKLELDPILDVNETTAIALKAKNEGKSAVIILGGGSPKNFILQTIPQLEQLMRVDIKGHDYFIQITDARPDTGGLSGATPHEAVSWGKVDPEMLPEAIVAYLDSTVALPLIGAYVLAKRPQRNHKRLYDQRETLLEALYEIGRKAPVTI